MEAKQYIVLSNSVSKRALFPSTRHNRRDDDDDDDDDSLGARPLQDSSPDRFSSPPPSPYWLRTTPVKYNSTCSLQTNLNKRFDEVVQVSGNANKKKNFHTPEKYDEIIAETPEKSFTGDTITPLKDILTRVQRIEETPDSTTSAITNLTRLKELKRKMYDQNISFKENIKEKPKRDLNTALSLIQNSFYKSSNGKARVSLFPEKSTPIFPKRVRSLSFDNKPLKKLKHSSSHRRTFPKSHRRSRSSFGEINNGVFHKIRRPKPKKIKAAAEMPKVLPSTRVEQYVIKNAMLDLENKIQSTSAQNNNYNKETEKIQSKQVIQEYRNDKQEHSEPELELNPEPEPDPRKKFFKTNRTMAYNQKAIVNIGDNIKLKVHKGKISLSERVDKKKNELIKNSEAVAEKEFDDETSTEKLDQVHKSVQLVLRRLEDEIPENLISKLNHKETLTSDHLLTLKDNVFGESQQSSNGQIPMKISEEELSQPVESKIISNTTEQKLYPVFYKEKRNFDAIRSPQKKTPVSKKFRLIGDDQYQIDAGQIRFRAVQCGECGVLYHQGDPDDEMNHYNIHHNVPILKFLGWKNEREVRAYLDGRVIVIYPDDPKSWLKKATDVLSIVNQELGFVNLTENLNSSKVYLYIKKKRIAGILVAEVRKTAYRMLCTDGTGPDCCTEETYSVKCGVSRIWTTATDRRTGVATRLMDCMRVSFFFDHFLSVDEIAFSVPTDDGKVFAQHYMKTPQYMVYYR